jgi:predicted hydrocarbon binding protein
MKEILSVDEKRRLVVLNSIFMKIQKTLEASIGSSSDKVLYTAGNEFGHKYMEVMKRDDKKTTIQNLLSELEVTDFVKARFNPDDMSFTVTDSSIALSYGESKEPVCHFLAGFFAGIVSEYLEKEDISYVETSCIAQGDEHCIFEQGDFPYT